MEISTNPYQLWLSTTSVKDTLIHFTCIHNMNPANDPPPASEALDVDTIGGDSTKEAANVDDQERERVHRGLEKLAATIFV
jgi:hypothetical protein